MGRWVIAVLSVVVCGGCDYLFQMDRLSEPAGDDAQPVAAPEVVITASGQCATCNATATTIQVQPGRAHTALLVAVAISTLTSESAAAAVTSLRLGPSSFTFVARQVALDGSKPAVEHWLLVDPPEGPGTVSVALNGPAAVLIVGVVQIEGTSADPVRASRTSAGTMQEKSADNAVESVASDLVIDSVCAGTSVDQAGPGQTVLFTHPVNAQATCANMGASSARGAAIVPIHWDVNGAYADHWIDVASSIKPAP